MCSCLLGSFLKGYCVKIIKNNICFETWKPKTTCISGVWKKLNPGSCVFSGARPCLRVKVRMSRPLLTNCFFASPPALWACSTKLLDYSFKGCKVRLPISRYSYVIQEIIANKALRVCSTFFFLLFLLISHFIPFVISVFSLLLQILHNLNHILNHIHCFIHFQSESRLIQPAWFTQFNRRFQWRKGLQCRIRSSD